MKYFKLARYKSLYIVCFIAFLIFVFNRVWNVYFFFDTKDPDLAEIGGELVKHKILIKNLTLDNLLFELGFYTSFLMPLIIVIMGKDYLSIKNSFIKLFIGKNMAYNDQVRKCKNQLAWFLVGGYLIIFGFVVGIPFLLKNNELTMFGSYFKHDVVLKKIIHNQQTYLLYYAVVVCVAIYFNSMLYFKILDVVKNFLRGGGVYLSIIWLSSLILYRLLPYYLVPMTTFMNISYPATILTLICPYIPIAILYIIIDRYAHDI